jgi:hypothetical protein
MVTVKLMIQELFKVMPTVFFNLLKLMVINLCKLETLGVRVNGKEIGLMILSNGLLV